MKQLLIFLLFVSWCTRDVSAQVGIGNVVPESQTILDLTNTNNRGFLLPQSYPNNSSAPTGVLFYSFNDNSLFYKESSAINGLGAWKYKFNYSFSNNVYYNHNGYVGIGTSAPFAPLHIKSNDTVVAIEGVSSSIISFYPTTYSNGEKAAISINSTNSNNIKITNNYNGGNVQVEVGTGGSFNVVGGKVFEYGIPVLTPGMIMMWYGSINSIPSGWGLCNGDTYSRVDGTGTITTPNLSSKFVVGAGDAYNVAQTGGATKDTLTTDNFPIHNHNFSTSNASGGAHKHKIYYSDKTSGGSPLGDMLEFENDGVGADGSLYTNNNADDGYHTHNYSFTTSPTGGNGNNLVLDNLPPYYVLCYIMKL